MSVKASWFTPPKQTAVDEDPFAAPIEEVGVPVPVAPVGDDEMELANRLVELVRQQGEIAARGVRCAIKDMDGTSCHACPLSEHDRQTPKGALCRLGREQEVALTRLAVLGDS